MFELGQYSAGQRLEAGNIDAGAREYCARQPAWRSESSRNGTSTMRKGKEDEVEV